MVNVNVTLIGDTVVLATNDDMSEARSALAFANTRDGHYVWITGEWKVSVLRGYELHQDEFDSFAGQDATKDDLDAILQADYVRYNDTVIPLADFSTTWGANRDGDTRPSWMQDWDAHLTDSASSGLVLRFNKADEDDHLPDFTGESGVTIATFITG